MSKGRMKNIKQEKAKSTRRGRRIQSVRSRVFEGRVEKDQRERRTQGRGEKGTQRDQICFRM